MSKRRSKTLHIGYFGKLSRMSYLQWNWFSVGLFAEQLKNSKH